MKNQMDEWNKIFRQHHGLKPKYDDWLDKYENILQTSKETPIIDLGCGFGNDSLYLFERGYPVISCDYSIEALRIIRSLIPNAATRQFDILNGLPFSDRSAKVIIADLAIHYFSWQDTTRVVDDIFRVLDDGGHLLCRVNSIKDLNHGAGQGIRLENGYYDINGKLKRFFDERQIDELFVRWQIINRQEYTMDRYSKEKIVWEVAVKNS